MKLITVIIPNWNGVQFLNRCLGSLQKQDTDIFEILLVDNASSDDSVSFTRTHFPEVKILENSKNLGFAGGVNQGILKAETPYVILLNNDVETEPHFVRGLYDAISASEKIFSVSARMINFNNREVLDDCGDTFNVFGFQAQRGVGRPIGTLKYLKPASVFSSCAGAAIYKRSVFQEIGLFDEAHFAYLEDIDVGYRGLLYGYKNRYTPDAVVYHIGSASSGGEKYSELKVELSARNSCYVVYKNMPPFFRGLNALPIYIGRKIKQRFFRKIGLEQAYLKGLEAGKAGCSALKQVPFSLKYAGRYLKIEGRMILYTFSYVAEYLKRRVQ